MNLLTEAYFDNADFDRSKFKDVFEVQEIDPVDAVYDVLDGNTIEIVNTVIDYAPEDELALTLKHMLLAYHNSLHAFKKSDREISKDDFVVFAKSFAITCINAIEKSAED